MFVLSAFFANHLVAALRESFAAALVVRLEDRAALDLALGLVVRLRATPRVSDGERGVIRLDAPTADECPAHL